jgi:hypothetical protein
MAGGVTCTGDRLAAHRMQRMAQHAGQQQPTMAKAAHQTQRQIKGVPVDTGRLQRGVHGGSEAIVVVHDDGFVVGTTVPYARHVFNGTKYMAARPPHVPDVGRLVATDMANSLDRA